MKILSFVLLPVLLLCVVVGTASAGDVETFDSPLTPSSFTSANFSNIGLTLPMFDSTLGTLTGVTIELEGWADITVIGENTGTSGTYESYGTGNMSMFLLTVGDITLVTTTPTDSFGVAPGPGNGFTPTYGITIDQSGALGAGWTSCNNAIANSDAAVCTETLPTADTFNSTSAAVPNSGSTAWNPNFEAPGGGTIDLLLDANLTTTTTSNGTGNTGSSGTAQGEAIITYDYNPPSGPTPEPVSMVLLGSGLACLGLLKRKRFTR